MATTTEMTEKVEQVKVMSGFAKRNANKERIEQEEKELEEMMNSSTETEENTVEQEDDGPEPTSAEEKTFKKRYGDLRRHAQKKEEELQKQIDDLKLKLEESTKQELKLPKTDEQLERWMEKHPNVAKIVETIAMKKAMEQTAEYEHKFRQIDEMKLEALREKAEAELMRIHPDFEEIRDGDDFHDWVEEQPKWVKDALYDNDTDAVSAARAIDLYKADKGIKTKKSSSNKDAAKAVGTRSERSSPDSDESKGYIKESDVARMSAQQYEKMSEQIAEAIRTNKFIYDMSGSAR